MTARLLPEAKVRNATLNSTSTISRRRYKLPDRRPTPARGRVISNDRCTQGGRMSCGILPRDQAGQLRGRVIVAICSEALGTFSWNE
ncbi:hypothetical protein CCHR01_18076 [Colletotrichum chrysophilum]|uniref:Uncharacterized protein n=1 Tax=Colletotrichum chrysophilum TaxID=1836956 RepID=A0AAD9A0R1_9PEZI|nr:hypothetical protein CCHR01_18076 [Colletotrichum chrysophilum]